MIVAEGCSWNGVDIRLIPAGTEGDGTGTASASQTDNVIHAEMGAVRPGSYDLTWSFEGKPLGAQRNLKVAGNETIARIDLREALFRHTITLVRNDGTPEGALLWRPAGAATEWQDLDFDKSPVQLSVPAQRVDLRIYARGCRAVSLTAVEGECRVQLRPGFRVRFVLQCEGAVPAHPYIFDPAPMVNGKYVGEPIGSPYFTADKREATFLLPAGPIEVGWHLERRAENGAVGANVLGEHNVKLDVLESSGEQVFVLPLDGGALERFVKNVGW